jgi:hypothetical protein
MNPTPQTRWIAFSERVYRVLLLLYPADYRREYGWLMVQLFRDVCRQRYHQQGRIGIALWWCRTVFDLALTVIEQRRKVRLMISKATFVHFAGFMLVLGGAFSGLAAFSQLQPDDHFTYHGLYQVLILLWAPGTLFVGLGCVGLALSYESIFWAKWTLYLCGVGSLVMTAGMFATFLNESLWNLWFIGALLHISGLTAFGLRHAFKPVLPCFRGLPLQMALGWVIIGLGILRTDSQTTNNLLSFLMFIGTGLAWLAIGQAIHRQRQQAEPAVA